MPTAVKRYNNFTRADRPFLRRDLPAIAVLGQRCGVAMRKSATALKEQIGISLHKPSRIDDGFRVEPMNTAGHFAQCSFTRAQGAGIQNVIGKIEALQIGQTTHAASKADWLR